MRRGPRRSARLLAARQVPAFRLRACVKTVVLSLRGKVSDWEVFRRCVRRRREGGVKPSIEAPLMLRRRRLRRCSGRATVLWSAGFQERRPAALLRKFWIENWQEDRKRKRLNYSH